MGLEYRFAEGYGMGLLTVRIALFAVVAMVATSAAAQTVVSGTVNDTDGGAAIPGARIQIHGISGAASRGTFSDSRGTFRLRDVQPGAYTLVVSAVGYAKTLDSIVVKADEPLVLTKRLTQEVSTRDEIVITASRYEQKASEAPASISVVDARAIQQRPTNTPVEQIKGQAGVDMAQTGVSSLTVNVRGFNNAFSGALMTLTDYRVSGVPSLRANIPYFIPLLNEDIERIELVRGPGSALYGPNAAQGVLNIISRSPFSSKGTTVYMSGGNQSLISGGVRHAGSVGDKFGYKVSGQYFNANEWAYVDPVEQAARASAIAGGANPDTLKIGQRINTHERFNVEARMDYALTEEAMITVSGGMTQAMNSIEQTDLGASNARNWRYYFANVQLNWNDLFIQSFYNKSDAGGTYLLRSGTPIIDRSDLFAVRLQHASRIADRVRLTYGGDFFLTRPETDGTITGRYENEDSYSEVGAYVQADADIIENKLHALVALRGDKHSVLIDPVLSPRAALLYKIDDNHTVRGTFNQAFTTPTTTDMFLDLMASQDAFGFGAANPAWAVNVRALGPARTGFQFDRIGNDPVFRSQFSPDKNAAVPLANASVFWDAATAVVLSQLGSVPLDSATKALLGAFLTGLAAPTTVGGTLGLLNPETATFSPVASSSVQDIGRLRPTKTTTYELGYTGLVADKLDVRLDVFYTEVKDFISPLQIVTPNVFLDQAATQAYVQPQMKAALMAQGMPEAQAEATATTYASIIAAAYAQVPIGTVTPSNSPYPTDVMLTSRNYGNMSYYGFDLGLGYNVNTEWSIYGSASVINKNYFTAEELGGISAYSLNAPKYKSSLGVKYSNNDAHVSAGLQWRWVDGFSMNSGVYIGSVQAYNLVDVNARYSLPMVEGLSLTLTVTNLLNMPVQQFVGAPTIGRLAQLRVAFTF